MNTHIQWYSAIPMDIPIFLLFKIPIPYVKRHNSVCKCFFDKIQFFIFFKVSNHLILCNFSIKHEVIFNFSKSTNQNQKFSKKFLPQTITQVFHLKMQIFKNKHDLNADIIFFYSTPQA